MTRSQVYWGIALTLSAVTLIASAALYPWMPNEIPIHWNIHGQVDGYGSRSVGLFLMPAFLVGVLAFFAALPALSPKNFEVDSFRETYLFVMVTVAGLFAYIHGVALFMAWKQMQGADKSYDIGRLLIGGMFLFFMAIGNVLGKVRRNFYIGVRTPWTIASDRVWNDTHRLAAWLMVGGGLIGFLITATGLPIAAAFTILIVSALAPVAYSFVHYKRLERRQAL